MVLTYETRLDKKNAGDLIEYFSGYIDIFAQIQRYAWHRLLDGNVKKAALNTEIQNKFGVSKRAANSAISDMQGRLKALKALKRTEMFQYRVKIAELQCDIGRIEDQLAELKPKITENKATIKQLDKYRKLKSRIYWKRQKLNKVNMRLERLQQRIAEKKYSMCFGSKKLFKAQHNLKENGFSSHQNWLTDFRRRRDSNILYLGSHDETQGNQMFQVLYDEGKDLFSARVRTRSGSDKYVEGSFGFNYKTNGFDVKQHIIDTLGCHENSNMAGRHGSPYDKAVSYRICRRGRIWYLQIMTDIDKRVVKEQTRSAYGAVGLDYNVGFISLSETNEHGNLLYQKHIPLRHKGTSSKAESEIRETMAKIVNHCIAAGKDLAIEELDFIHKKSKSYKGKSKKQNRTLHLFDYSRYMQSAETCCHKNGVGLHLINPYMTSAEGREKYSEQRKLSSHQAAALVIARRAQGFIGNIEDVKLSA